MSETSAEPVTLITGGGSGIGAEAARQLLGRGHRVVITGRRGDRLRKLAAELGDPPGLIYGATKWAVTAMAENTRRMVTGDGVGVTLINPGAVATSFWDGDGGLPDRPMLTAGQVAAAIVWALGQPEGVDVNTLTIRPIGAPIA